MNKQLTLDEKIRAIRSALRDEPKRLRRFNSAIDTYKSETFFVLEIFVTSISIVLFDDNFVVGDNNA